MKKLILFALSFGLLLFVHNVAHACSCDTPYIINGKGSSALPHGVDFKGLIQSEREHADAVFSGVATQVVVDQVSKTYEAKFKVLRSWKNVDYGEVSLFGSTRCCLCVYQFKAGESYLVYAHSREGNGGRVLGASICSRTARLKYAGDDLKVLGKGSAPKVKNLAISAAKPNNSLEWTRK